MTPVTLSEFSKILDKNLKEILYNYLDPKNLIAPKIFGQETTDTAFVEYWQIGSVPDIPRFTGKLEYLPISPGFWTRIEPAEFAGGLIFERKLIDDKQFAVFNDRQESLARSLARTKEKKAANAFNYAFSTAWEFMQSEEGVALCGTHTTKSGYSGGGLVNAGTSTLSKTSIAATRILMSKFVDDLGNPIDIMPDTLLVPTALYDQACEAVGYDPRSGASSQLAPETDNLGKINVLYKSFTVIEWPYLDLVSTTNWFMLDSRLTKKLLVWIDRIKAEVNTTTDFETFMIKHSIYSRFGWGFKDWRFVFGHLV